MLRLPSAQEEKGKRYFLVSAIRNEALRSIDFRRRAEIDRYNWCQKWDTEVSLAHTVQFFSAACQRLQRRYFRPAQRSIYIHNVHLRLGKHNKKYAQSVDARIHSFYM